MVQSMANVTRDTPLATNCILLNGIIIAVTLHFLFHLHFLLPFFWVALQKQPGQKEMEYQTNFDLLGPWKVLLGRRMHNGTSHVHVQCSLSH